MMKLWFGEGTCLCYQVVLQESILLLKQRSGLNIGTTTLSILKILREKLL